MKTNDPIKAPQNVRLSIVHRILDGQVTITSPEEFEDVLSVYKDDPFLHRKFADLLSDLKQCDRAADAYETAAALFIDKQMNLQAVVAKILQWSIQKASHHQGRAFYAMLHEDGGRQTPLQRFWARMRYSELVAVMRRLVRVRLTSDIQVIHPGDPAEELFFVVSGALCETTYPKGKGAVHGDDVGLAPAMLGPNDIFGDVFPLQMTAHSTSHIRTLTEVELVKIAKPVLCDLCSKHPRIAALLQDIRHPGRRSTCDRSWQAVRRDMRYCLPTKAHLDFPSMQTRQGASTCSGIACDLSFGGMCMEILPDPCGDVAQDLKGHAVYIHLDLLNDVVMLNLTGRIAWQRRHPLQKQTALLVGIRFDPLSDEDHDMLAEYLSGSVGEQNLLWGLWDDLVNAEGIIN